MNVDWRWHSRFRGLLPLPPHALAEDGRLLLVRPDELEVRKYQILQVEGSCAASDPARNQGSPATSLSGSVAVETVRHMWLTAEAPVMIGATDNDLYLFREGRKNRFLAERRVTYLAVALARGGGFFAAAFTDMMFAGQTLALADAGGKVIWTKDLDAPIMAVGIAPDGRTVTAGLEDGLLLAFDASRSLLWEAVLEAPAVALAVTRGGERCVAVTASGTVLAIDGGDVTWRAELAPGAALTPGAVAVACDERGALVALAGGDSDGWVSVLDAEGQTAWEYGTSARVTGVAVSPSGSLLALSQSDGELLLFTVESGDPTSAAGRRGPDEEFQRALAARDAGRSVEARAALLQVLDADPGHLPACDALIELDDAARSLSLAEANRLAGEARFAEALAALEAARAVSPADVDLPRRWSELLEAAETHAAGAAAQAEAAGDTEAAVAHWRSLLQLDPKRRHAREEVARLSRLVAEQLVRNGEAALAAGREEEALAAWRRAQAAAPSEALTARVRDLEVQRCMRAGIALYGQQRFPEAAFQFRKALALQPDHPEALRYLAYIGSAGPQSALSERFSRLE